jgi:hypothetical protein
MREKDERRIQFLENDEVWPRLPGAQLGNRVMGWGQKSHIDSGQSAGYPPPSCSLGLLFRRRRPIHLRNESKSAAGPSVSHQ